MSRSFTGCKRCKARRQKCDEKRPECSRCLAAKTPCLYAMQLQWGGRTFARSRFGACMGPDGRMQKLEYSPGEFVYTTRTPASAPSSGTAVRRGAHATVTRASSGPVSPRPSPTASPSLASSSLSSSPSTPSPSSSLSSPATWVRSIDPFSSLTSEQKALLHHFINDASQITACHSGMQRDICQMLIPMALQTPSLLYATTALSAIHLQALSNQSASVKSAPDIARLMALSLEHFRKELQHPPRGCKRSDTLLATARTLCLAEIHSGAIHPNTWRAHVEGAKALMATSDGGGFTNASTTSSSSSSSTNGEGRSFGRYLDRWYRSIVSLTALTGNGPPIGEMTDRAVLTVMGQSSASPDYLDDYWGFTVHLSEIFREIGAAAWRRHQQQQRQQHQRHELDDDSSSSSSNGIAAEHDASTTPQQEAAVLESSVRRLMDRHATSQPTFYPGVAEGLSAQCIQEFALCNEAFQHCALIQIHRRLRNLPATSVEVQASVRQILACTMKIAPSAGLSPWVMLTTPLFIAGCEARGERDREVVRHLLRSLHRTICIPNVLQSLQFLEQYWANQIDEDEDWSRFLGRMQFDFIPY